jgi:transposase
MIAYSKSTMLGISKRGNRMLRTLFIHGARAAFTRTKNRDCHLLKWADKIAEKRGQPKAWVALANKLARVTWAIVNKKVNYVAEP